MEPQFYVSLKMECVRFVFLLSYELCCLTEACGYICLKNLMYIFPFLAFFCLFWFLGLFVVIPVLIIFKFILCILVVFLHMLFIALM